MGIDPSAAPGLKDGRGRAGHWRVHVFFQYPSLSYHAISPIVEITGSHPHSQAITKFGKSSNPYGQNTRPSRKCQPVWSLRTGRGISFRPVDGGWWPPDAVVFGHRLQPRNHLAVPVSRTCDYQPENFFGLTRFGPRIPESATLPSTNRLDESSWL